MKTNLNKSCSLLTYTVLCVLSHRPSMYTRVYGSGCPWSYSIDLYSRLCTHSHTPPPPPVYRYHRTRRPNLQQKYYIYLN